MNLRKVENYTIGLDLGSASVGWAVIDNRGDLCHLKGRNTWGSRLFPQAMSAADTRLKRGQRRRYDRRRWRLDLLQGFFLKEISEIDPDFFIRLNQARLHKKDRLPGHDSYRYPLFKVLLTQ